MQKSLRSAVVMATASLMTCLPARAGEQFTFLTNWFAQAEHGGFYQALAEGTYKKHGLDVTIKMGGPQINVYQLMAAGQADCVMGSNEIQVMQLRSSGLPVKTVAAVFQKEAIAIIAHDDVKSLADLKGKTVLISTGARTGYWLWLKAKYGLSDSQTRPFTNNFQPFVADENAATQSYVTTDPSMIEKLGIKYNRFLISDYGYPTYSTVIACLDKTIAERGPQIAAFIKATAEGYKSYLANPEPGNAILKSENPKQTAADIDYTFKAVRDTKLVTGGDAIAQGIGTITDDRMKATYDTFVSLGVIDPLKVSLDQTYTTQFVAGAKILP